MPQMVKVAHFRLSHSRQMFLAAYPRESQEMVFDAHNRAFAFFGGVPNQMIYDNPKTIVDAIFSGKERRFNRRFLALASHYLFEPVACTPASGWEKGQIENQVGNVREWLLTPAKPVPIGVPRSLTLALEPQADCSRYDSLRGGVPCWLN